MTEQRSNSHTPQEPSFASPTPFDLVNDKDDADKLSAATTGPTPTETSGSSPSQDASCQETKKPSSPPRRESTAHPRPKVKIAPRGIGPVTKPNQHDVLCGRGGRVNAHVGNVQFREMVNQRKRDYLAPTTQKMEKAHVAAKLVEDIRNLGGRFLLEDDDDGMWYDIGDTKAIRKVGQAMRQNAPCLRRELYGDVNQDENNNSDEFQANTQQAVLNQLLLMQSMNSTTTGGGPMTAQPQQLMLNNNMFPNNSTALNPTAANNSGQQPPNNNNNNTLIDPNMLAMFAMAQEQQFQQLEQLKQQQLELEVQKQMALQQSQQALGPSNNNTNVFNNNNNSTGGAPFTQEQDQSILMNSAIVNQRQEREAVLSGYEAYSACVTNNSNSSGYPSAAAPIQQKPSVSFPPTLVDSQDPPMHPYAVSNAPPQEQQQDYHERAPRNNNSHNEEEMYRQDNSNHPFAPQRRRRSRRGQVAALAPPIDYEESDKKPAHTQEGRPRHLDVRKRRSLPTDLQLTQAMAAAARDKSPLPAAAAPHASNNNNRKRLSLQTDYTSAPLPQIVFDLDSVRQEELKQQERFQRRQDEKQRNNHNEDEKEQDAFCVSDGLPLERDCRVSFQQQPQQKRGSAKSYMSFSLESLHDASLQSLEDSESKEDDRAVEAAARKFMSRSDTYKENHDVWQHDVHGNNNHAANPTLVESIVPKDGSISGTSWSSSDVNKNIKEIFHVAPRAVHRGSFTTTSRRGSGCSRRGSGRRGSGVSQLSLCSAISDLSNELMQLDIATHGNAN